MSSVSFRSLAPVAAVALICGFGGAALWTWSGLGHSQTKAYLLDNPGILPDMVASYEKEEAGKRLAQVAGDVTEPFPGAVLGNPEGTVTLVEFTDYGCGYCRKSADHVAKLISSNPDLRVVVREWPIFEGSDHAAKMALAAAKQGKFRAFHDAMFAQGNPTRANISAAANTAKIDMDQARRFIEAPDAGFELSKNMAFAQQLGFSGTPSWIIGGAVLEGAVGQAALQDAIDAARAL
ncbi:DsbA family protein [Pontixanthobacter sp.]|uniref:DsbA family protein n=1 Tax=Pontixanthobacter sp. TaxID=2792078 RepID=UPI003C7D872F